MGNFVHMYVSRNKLNVGAVCNMKNTKIAQLWGTLPWNYQELTITATLRVMLT